MGISIKRSGLSFKVLFCDRLSIMEHSQKLNWFCNIITYFNYNACYKAHPDNMFDMEMCDFVKHSGLLLEEKRNSMNKQSSFKIA